MLLTVVEEQEEDDGATAPKTAPAIELPQTSAAQAGAHCGARAEET